MSDSFCNVFYREAYALAFGYSTLLFVCLGHDDIIDDTVLNDH